MNDEPQDEVGQRDALEREARTTPQVDPPGVMPGGAAEPAAEDVEIEVVLLSDDESGEAPRTLTSNGRGIRGGLVLVPGIVAAGGAVALLLKRRADRQESDWWAGWQRARSLGSMPTPSALTGLSGASKGFGAMAGDGKERARALAAQARARLGKTPPPPPRTAWELRRDRAQSVTGDNLVTIAALALSVALTVAARLIDQKREARIPLPPPPKQPWYRVGPWS